MAKFELKFGGFKPYKPENKPKEKQIGKLCKNVFNENETEVNAENEKSKVSFELEFGGFKTYQPEKKNEEKQVGKLCKNVFNEGFEESLESSDFDSETDMEL